MTREQLVRTRQLMDKAAPDALVPGYEYLIPSLNLPDNNDRHVLAAAIRCGAGVIVTSNFKDLPADALQLFDIEAQHPDEFIMHLFDLSPALVVEATENHRMSLKNPPKTMDEYLSSLKAQGLHQTVIAIRHHHQQA